MEHMRGTEGGGEAMLAGAYDERAEETIPNNQGGVSKEVVCGGERTGHCLCKGHNVGWMADHY